MMNIKDKFASRLGTFKGRNEEGADIVQTILIIAMFVVVCIIVGTLVMNAIESQAEGVADCISNSHDIKNNGCTNYNG